MSRTPSEAATVFAELLETKFPEDEFFVEPGTKMDRIVQLTKKNSGQSVHCFVEKSTGYVYKAAGYRAPAKGVRFTNVLEAFEKSDRFGSYLYL